MKPLKLFISSVQKEFATERIALAQYIREDSLLGSFFDVFLFEEIAANSYSTAQVYLSEVEASQIYLGILGNEYGYEDAQGVSPTEREFDGIRDVSNQVSTAYEIPRRVIAEAIINTIAHRNYYSKASVQVSVFKDRIEVFNPGQLPNELEFSDLSIAHGSYPHNPLLANCMFLTGDIERFGTGTLEIFYLLEEAHLSRPQFNLEEGFKVILYRPWSQTAHDTIHDTIHDSSHFALANLTHRLVWKIQGEMSRDELMVTLELKNRDNFQKSYIKPAIEDGLIENTLPDKKTSKNQKYRLTKKGLSLQKRLKNEVK